MLRFFATQSWCFDNGAPRLRRVSKVHNLRVMYLKEEGIVTKKEEGDAKDS